MATKLPTPQAKMKNFGNISGWVKLVWSTLDGVHIHRHTYMTVGLERVRRECKTRRFGATAKATGLVAPGPKLVENDTRLLLSNPSRSRNSSSKCVRLLGKRLQQFLAYHIQNKFLNNKKNIIRHIKTVLKSCIHWLIAVIEHPTWTIYFIRIQMITISLHL